MDIVHEIDIAATAESVYTAITTQEGLSGWYTPEVKAEPRAGGLVELKFGTLTTLQFRVEKLRPNRQVIWTGIQVPDEWKSTPVTFDIVPDGNSVNLRFSQTGFTSDYEPFAGFSYCWGQYVRSLKLLLETGRGEPFGSPGSKAAGTTPQSHDTSPVKPEAQDQVTAIIGSFAAQLNDPDKPLSLVARFQVKAGTEAAVEAAFAEASEETRHECGVVTFDLNRDAQDGSSFVVYERWRSLADLDQHLRTEYITKLRNALDQLIVGTPEFQVLIPASTRVESMER